MSPFQALEEAVRAAGVDAGAWGLAWARVAPSIAIVPAFGLRAVPAPVRVALGLAMALAIAPALGPHAATGRPWQVAVLIEAAEGVPVALSAAAALWAAGMAGGLVDNLRGGREEAALPVVESGSTPTGTLLALLAVIAFLESGGAARVAAALAAPDLAFVDPLAHAARDVARGIEIAIAVAAPVLGAAVVVEVAGALVARAATPASIHPLIMPVRSLILLGIAALVFDRMAALLAARALG